MLLRNARIGRKLATLLLTSIIFFVVIGGTGFYYMNKMNSSSEAMYRDALLPIKWQDRLNINNRAIDSFILEYLITSDSNDRKDLQGQIDARKIENENMVNLIGNSLLSDFEIERLAKFKVEYEAYLNGIDEIFKLEDAGKEDLAYTKYREEVTISRGNANTLLNEIGDYLEDYADQLNADIAKDHQTSTVIVIIVILLVIAVEVTFGWIITRMIVNPVKEMKQLMEDAEKGDLTVAGKYKSKDEIGLLTASFNSMMIRLRELMKQVNVTSEQVAISSEELTLSAEQSGKASEEIATTIQEVATGAENQVTSIEESSKVVEDMAQSIQQIALNAQELSSNVMETSEKAIEGNLSIQSTINQMNSINFTVTDLAQVVKRLGEHSQEIGNIVEAITNIAGQTNLLALNAAIESARAGEHGRGFAVVADEVRKLSVQSAESAQSIAKLIDIIQAETRAAVQSMEKTTSEVNIGLGVVNNAGESFAAIRNSITEVSHQIQDVSAAAQQLSAGSEQVLRSEKELAEIAEEAASGSQNVAAAIEEQLASTEEISASASSLAHMAGELQDQIRRFKV